MSYQETVSTLHCALENGAELYVNERQKIRHYRVGSTLRMKKKKKYIEEEEEEEEEEEDERKKKENGKSLFFTSRGAYVNSANMAVLYSLSFENQPYNMMVVFKMLDSVPSER